MRMGNTAARRTHRHTPSFRAASPLALTEPHSPSPRARGEAGPAQQLQGRRPKLPERSVTRRRQCCEHKVRSPDAARAFLSNDLAQTALEPIAADRASDLSANDHSEPDACLRGPREEIQPQEATAVQCTVPKHPSDIASLPQSAGHHGTPSPDHPGTAPCRYADRRSRPFRRRLLSTRRPPVLLIRCMKP